MGHTPYDVPRLLLLTDRSQLHLGRGLVRTVAECVDAGLTHVVVRELDETPEQRAALAEALAATGARVIAAREPLPHCVGVHLAADHPLAESAETARRVGTNWRFLPPEP